MRELKCISILLMVIMAIFIFTQDIVIMTIFFYLTIIGLFLFLIYLLIRYKPIGNGEWIKNVYTWIKRNI